MELTKGITHSTYALVAGVLLVPFVAGASFTDIDAWIEEVRESGTGTIIESHTSATSHTGSVTAGAGESVSTGPNTASASVTTTITTSSSEEGSVEVEVVTEENGKVYTETVQKSIPPGEGVEVRVVAPSKPGESNNTQSEVRIESTAKTQEEDATLSSEEQRVPAEPKDTDWLSEVTVSVSTFISSIFSLFIFW